MSLHDGKHGSLIVLQTENPDWLSLGVRDQSAGDTFIRILVRRTTLLRMISAAAWRPGNISQMAIYYGLREDEELKGSGDAAAPGDSSHSSK
jgi:hypothetical protein